MTIVSAKPTIFISYSHEDDPEQPREGEERWLTFVLTYLQPAIKDGIFDVWVDSHMVGGADWNSEIETRVRACDIFILLVSIHSMASDYIVDKEIAIIRERQTAGDDVHFYPLLLTHDRATDTLCTDHWPRMTASPSMGKRARRQRLLLGQYC